MPDVLTWNVAVPPTQAVQFVGVKEETLGPSQQLPQPVPGPEASTFLNRTPVPATASAAATTISSLRIRFIS